MTELLVDLITSLDGYAAAEGWPGWWGLEGPEYLAWLGDQPEAVYTVLMGDDDLDTAGIVFYNVPTNNKYIPDFICCNCV